MGHSLSLGLDETYRIYYLHIYIRIYMRYNFAATAVAAQPWTWCNVRNTLPPRPYTFHGNPDRIRRTVGERNVSRILSSRLVDLVPPRRQPGRSLSLVSRPPAHLDLPRPFSLSLPFSPYLLFPARLRREHRIWWNETPTAALITNDRNLNEPDTFPGEFFRCGPQAPRIFYVLWKLPRASPSRACSLHRRQASIEASH